MKENYRRPLGKSGDGIILLFQPATTVKEPFSPNREFLKRAFEDVIDLSALVHVRTLQCDHHSDELGGIYALGPKCGGQLQIKSVSTLKLLRVHSDTTGVALTCSNCDMTVTSSVFPTRESLSNLLLHLMLKQMVPALSVAESTDCSLRKSSLIQGSLSEAQSLGLVSVASEVLWGYVGNHGRPIPERYGFGFMLTPGMQTADGCGGFDEWLKFLIEKKFESLQNLHRSLAESLLGPKPIKG